MRKLFRFTFRLLLVVGAIGAIVVVARKLMGGLGSESGTPTTTTDWPSMASPNPITDAPTASTPESANGNGAHVAVNN